MIFNISFEIGTDGVYFTCANALDDIKTNFDPYIMMVTTLNIESQYFDNKKVKSLAIITLSENKSKIMETDATLNQNHEIYHKEFSHPQFYKLGCETLRSLEITLLDSALSQA